MTTEITPREALDEINRLNRERDALKQQLATAERIIEFKDKVITAIEIRAEAAEADAQRMRETLEAVEWVGSFISCPWCRGEEHNGHYPDCQRQAALDGGKEGGGE